MVPRRNLYFILKVVDNHQMNLSRSCEKCVGMDVGDKNQFIVLKIHSGCFVKKYFV